VHEPRSDALRALGWDDDWAKAAAAVAPDAPVAPGRVARVDRGVATVLVGDRTVRAALERDTGAFAGTVATGDWVLVSDVTGEPVVAGLVPRRSAFVRGDPFEGVALDAQVIAANVDTVFVVQALSNGPNLRRLERELVLAFQSGAAPVVVLTKHDLVGARSDVDAAVASVARIAPDVPVVVTSAATGYGLDALVAFAPAGRTVALIGASGVGKSTLVNRLAGHDVQATSEVRERDQRGRHTTIARELVPLPSGGLLIDTPGLRAVSLWEAETGIDRAFADIETLSRDCRFRDCRHEREPDCAVRRAADDGRLDRARLESYQRLCDELDRHATIAEESARRGRGRRRR
jgi:ribosome biogenesis GTPase / thiamine phosphate phosphatase